MNADDTERCRVRYGIAATLRVAEGVSLLTEIIGSSGTATDRFVVRGILPLSELLLRVPRRLSFEAAVARTDIVEAGVGIKVHLIHRLIGFASELLPLTSEGVYAEVVPVGGVEMTF